VIWRTVATLKPSATSSFETSSAGVTEKMSDDSLNDFSDLGWNAQ